MPSPRPLVSGRDFQLRYAIHRLTLLALGHDALHDRAARIRLEWPLLGGELWADLVIEDQSGAILEFVECKEHEGYLDRRSVMSFLADVEKLPEVNARFVSNARFLHDGSDFAKPDVRARITGATAARIVWELGTPSKSALTGECLLHFTARTAEARELYARLYSRLAGLMSHRLERDGDVFVAAVHDLHQFFFERADAEQLRAELSRAAGESFAVEDLRREIERRRSRYARAAKVSREWVDCALRRNLFDEAKVSLADIFIEPWATATLAITDTERTQFSDSALALLFQGLGRRRRPDGAEVRGVANEILVLGQFGSGKSSLLTTFAGRLLDSGSEVMPLLVPLRDLIGAGTDRVDNVLLRYVRDKYRVDLVEEDEAEYCLLCDGFDELNLYYSDRKHDSWVESAYRQIVSVGQRQNVSIVISSRPVLLMGTRSTPRRGTTRIELEPFDDARIAAWCDRYRSAEGLDEGFTFAFLATRNLVDVARTPIVLYMIARIYESDRKLLEEKRYTAAEIYRLFIDWTIRGGYVKDDVKHELPQDYRHILQDIAWHLFEGGQGFLSEEGLLEKLRATWGEQVEARFLDRRLFVAHMLQPAGGERSTAIEFTHQSFREYLVAERLWRILGNVRHGSRLTAEVWFEAHGRPWTAAKVQFLNDMVMALDADEARSLFQELERAENIHTYWNEWAQPAWERGAYFVGRHFDVLPARAHAQATLAAILRIRAYARLVQLGREDSVEPPSGASLMDLLAYADSFRGTGQAGMTRSILLENVHGLHVRPNANFQRGFFVGANFTGCRIPQASFTQANLAGITVVDSMFNKSSFQMSSLNAQQRASGSSFAFCDFRGAEIGFGDPQSPAERIDFTGAKFDRASVDVYLTGCKLTGNTWKDTKASGRLVGCLLDRAAHDFFTAQGAALDDCTIV